MPNYIHNDMSLQQARALTDHLPQASMEDLEGGAAPRTFVLPLVFLRGKKCAVAPQVTTGTRRTARRQLLEKSPCHGFFLLGIPGTTNCALIYTKSHDVTKRLLQFGGHIAPGTTLRLVRPMIAGTHGQSDTIVLNYTDALIPVQDFEQAHPTVNIARYLSDVCMLP